MSSNDILNKINNLIEYTRNRGAFINLEFAPEDDTESKWEYEELREDFDEVYNTLMSIEQIIKKELDS